MAMEETPVVVFTRVTNISKLNKVQITFLDQRKTKVGLEFRYNRAICLDNPLLALID